MYDVNKTGDLISLMKDIIFGIEEKDMQLPAACAVCYKAYGCKDVYY